MATDSNLAIAWIAPGDHHMVIRSSEGATVIELNKGPPRTRVARRLTSFSARSLSPMAPPPWPSS